MTNRSYIILLLAPFFLVGGILTGCGESKTAEWHAEESLNLNQQGYYNKAIEEATKAIELDPELAKAYNSRAWAYGQRGQWDLAIADASKAIQLDEELTMAYVNRGWAYSNQNKWDLAIADYSRAIDLDPGNALLYADRAMAYKGKGEKAAAIADFEKFIDQTDDPQLSQVARQLIDELSQE